MAKYINFSHLPFNLHGETVVIDRMSHQIRYITKVRFEKIDGSIIEQTICELNKLTMRQMFNMQFIPSRW